MLVVDSRVFLSFSSNFPTQIGPTPVPPYVQKIANDFIQSRFSYNQQSLPIKKKNV